MRFAAAMLAVPLAIAEEPHPTPSAIMGPLHVLHLDAAEEDLGEGTSYGRIRAIRRVAFVAHCDPFASIAAKKSIDEFQAIIDKVQSLLGKALDDPEKQIVNHTFSYFDYGIRLPYQSNLRELFEYCEPLYPSPFHESDCNFCESYRKRRSDYPHPLKKPDRLKHDGPHTGPLRLRPGNSDTAKIKP